MRTLFPLRIALPFFILLIATQAASAQQSASDRKDTVVAFFRDTDVGVDYVAAASCINESETREDGLAMLELLTSSISSDVIERYRMTTVYVRLHDFLPDSMRQRIEYIWGHFPVRPFDSEHEKMAYYSSLYLMTRFETDDAVFFNGKSRSENELDARSYLLHWMKEVTEQGQREFDSPTYAPVMLASLVLLRDFAPDKDLRRQSEIMAQWLLADFVHDYLKGSYCGAHGREFWKSALNPASSEMSAVGWLYFGDGPRCWGREQLFLSLSDFEPHPAITRLLAQRAKPYESWERKQCAETFRSGASVGVDGSEDVIRYTYMDPLYGIGSIPGGLVQARDQHSWDVTWISEDPNLPATLYLMQPYSDPAALMPFMPHSGELALRSTGMIDDQFGAITKTVGGSPYEDVFQYRNTLMALYDIGTVSRFPAITGILPPKVKSLDVDSLRSHWITINTGDVYIGVYPLAPYRLIEGSYGTLYYSPMKRNGVIVQVVGRNEIGSYKEFMKKIRATRVDTTHFSDQLLLRYTTLKGDVMECTFGGARTVNGKTVEMQKDMLFESPFLESKRGSGMLTIKSDAGTVVLDMHAREIREE